MRFIGIDIGGTFTDVALYDSEREDVRVHKVRSTPEDPGQALVEGVVNLCERCGIAPADIDGVLHGTTVATNAVLEHRGAITGMVTTEGMRDVVHIGRHQRPQPYSVMQDIPWQARPFVTRQHRIGVPERIAPPDGMTLVALDEDAVRAAGRQLREAGVQAVAVCFLFSYLDPTHEERAAALLTEEMPDAFITTSADVSRQFREFERFTTACMNAFVGPGTGVYLERLVEALRARGVRSDLLVMRSNGGVASVPEAAARPVTLMLSGPAAGVLGAQWAGRLVDRQRLITFDMGGTSSDIGLVTESGVHEASARDTQIAGYPILVPMFDLQTIGAGGGSIARLDEGGAFVVGPRSAGAAPGPACYGLGGDEPTITDAHLVLGHLDAARFLGGELPLSVDAAEEAVGGLAAQLGLGLREAADGILTLANAEMARTIRSITIERGHDPRDFTLVAFGGAGPLHAAEVASLLDVPEVLVPPHPGITSAVGLLTSELRYDLMHTVFMVQDELDVETINGHFRQLVDELVNRLLREAVTAEEIRVERFLDCRYVGQGYELRIPVADEGFSLDGLAAFHRVHEAEYGHAYEDPIEVVNLRVTVTGERPRLSRVHVGSGDLESATIGEVLASWRLDGALVELPTRHLERERLPLEEPIPGPAIIFQRDTTILVPPRWTARATSDGPLMLAADSGTSDATLARAVSRAGSDRVDPITVNVIGGALTSIAVDMGYRLARMSYSSIIRESEDFGCAICDREGRQLCEAAQSTPLQSGPIAGYLSGIERRFREVGDRWQPGDVVVHNHPYYGASHQPDVAFCVPVFHAGELVGFSVTTAHHLDLGALLPGTCGIVTAADTYAEGLLLNAVKVQEGGRRVESAWRIIADNSRIPHLVLGDMEAQMAAAELGAARFAALLEQFGADRVRQASEDLMDHSERILRRQIERLPDGRYEAEGRLDGFVEHADPAYRDLPIKVAVAVSGSELEVDLSGTAPQVDLPINMPFVGTVDVAVYVTLRSLLLDTAHHDAVETNAGLFRPVTIKAPLGSLANPRFPAPTIARFCSGNIVADTLMRALAPVLPEGVAAGVGNLKVVAFSGQRAERAWVYMDIVEGSYGGRHGKDGLDAVDTLYANTRNNPAEDIESHYPLRVTRYELRDDGAGAGRWRGGLGSIREFEFLEDGGFSLEGEGNTFPPPGLFGGGPGAPGAVVMNPGTPEEAWLPSKIADRRVSRGEVLRLLAPCGGGYGDPAQRTAADRQRDAVDGIVPAHG